MLATHLHFDHAGGFTVRDAGGRAAAAVSARAVRRPPRRVGGRDASERAEPRQLSARTTSCRWPRPACCSSSTTTRRSCPACGCGGPAGTRCIIRWCVIESGGKTAAFVADLMPTTAHLPDAVDHGLRPVSDGHAGGEEGVRARRRSRRTCWCSSSTIPPSRRAIIREEHGQTPDRSGAEPDIHEPEVDTTASASASSAAAACTTWPS